jgi:hypothetical protein
VAANGIRSEMSKPVNTMPLDDYHPDPPLWNVPTPEPGGILLTWHSDNLDLRCLVQRKIDSQIQWENIGGWLERGVYAFIDTTRRSNETYSYRLVVMDVFGNRNKNFNIVSR